MPHTATELACGLVAPVALIAGLINRAGALSLGKSNGNSSYSCSCSCSRCCRRRAFFAGVFAGCRFSIWFSRSARRKRCASCAKIDSRAGLVGAACSFIASLLLQSRCRSCTDGRLRFSADLDFSGARCDLGFSKFFVRQNRFARGFRLRHVCRILLATYLCIPPNCGVPKYNLSQELTSPGAARSATALFERLSAARIQLSHREKTGTGRTNCPARQHIDVGRLAFCQRLQPDSRRRRRARIQVRHSRRNRSGCSANICSREQAGPEGELAPLGVDGIAVAQEVDVDPQPASEWQLVASTGEGRVFHRRVGRFARCVRLRRLIRGRRAICSATISRIDDSRNRRRSRCRCAKRTNAALLDFFASIFSRLRRAARAKNSTSILIEDCFRSWKCPRDRTGIFVLSYRPAWLVYGGGLSILCAIFLLPVL